MPFLPRGLESQKHPLKHRFDYSFGLSMKTDTMNSVWCTLIRTAKISTLIDPSTIQVNPHNTDIETETGPTCSPMSIIENLRLVITASKSAANATNNPIKFSWTPFFCAFGEKYDAADDDTGTTVAGVMQLTKDATNEDIIPTTAIDLPLDGNSILDHPMGTVNLAESGTTHYSMTTDNKMESCAFNMDAFQKILAHGTNKGALKSCLGSTRRYTVESRTRPVKTWFIRKFVPNVVRRIVPYSFFGILFHVPVETDIDSYFLDTSPTGSKPNIGFRVSVRYDEWNEMHDNTMVAV